MIRLTVADDAWFAVDAERFASILWAGALLGLLLLSACPAEPDIALSQRTRPPPARSASVDNGDRGEVSTVTLSRGVVLGVGCWNSCDYTCVAPTVTVADPAIAGVRRTYPLDGDDPEHALLGLSVGTTRLTLSDPCATREYTLRVVE